MKSGYVLLVSKEHTFDTNKARACTRIFWEIFELAFNSAGQKVGARMFFVVVAVSMLANQTCIHRISVRLSGYKNRVQDNGRLPLEDGPESSPEGLHCDHEQDYVITHLYS